MPQIPTYLAQENVNGVALQKAPRGGFDTVDLAGPTNQLVKAGGMFLKAQEEARLADMKLDVETQFNQMKVDFAQREIELKRAGMNPDDYPGAIQKALGESVKDAQSRLKYPDSAGAFQHVATPFAAGKLIDSKYDAEKIRHAQMETAAAPLQLQDANTSVFGASPEERQAAFERGLNRIDGLLRTGVWSGPKAASETAKFLSEVERGGFIKRFRDPMQRSSVMADLAQGKGTHMAPDAQLVLLKELQTQQDSEAEKARVAAEREAAAKADAAEKNITDAMANNDRVGALAILQTARADIKSGEEYRKWHEFITAAKDKSDPEILKQLDLEVYGLNGSDAGAIAKARNRVLSAASQLSPTDLRTLLAHTQSLRTSLGNRREDQALSQLGHRHSAVVDQIQEDLKVTGPMERLVPQAQNVKAMALDELRRRSAYTGGGEDPSDVYRQRKNLWISHIAGAAASRLNEIQFMLKYQDPQTLDANRANFKTEEDYYRQVRMMRDAQEIRKELKRIQDQQNGGGNDPGVPQEKPAAKSGGKSLGY